jgi:hypothetical protein
VLWCRPNADGFISSLSAYEGGIENRLILSEVVRIIQSSLLEIRNLIINYFLLKS